MGQFEAQIVAKYMDLEKRLWGELDGQTMLMYQQQQEEIARLKEETMQLQQHIERERTNQETIIREMRAHLDFVVVGNKQGAPAPSGNSASSGNSGILAGSVINAGQ